MMRCDVFGGAADAPVLHFALANGFPFGTYAPLLRHLTAQYRVVSLPPRPLWDAPPPPETMDSWRVMADDLLNGIRQHALAPVIGVGHSFGGVATMLAALAEPSYFSALILLDPTFLAPHLLQKIDAANRAGKVSRLPMVQGALKRRANFESVDAAYAYWREKPLFADWSDEAVRAYAESLTRPAEGGGVTLTWSPAWEARGYETIFTETWDEVPKLAGLMPVFAVRGTTTNAFVEESAAHFRTLLPQADYAEIEGHGHLFPMSAPKETAALMLDWLNSRGISG